VQKKSSYQGLALIQCTFAKFNVFKRHLFELPFRLITRDVISRRGILNVIFHWRSAKVCLCCACARGCLFSRVSAPSFRVLRRWGASGLLLGRGLCILVHRQQRLAFGGFFGAEDESRGLPQTCVGRVLELIFKIVNIKKQMSLLCRKKI